MERLTYIDNEGWYVNGENGERLRGPHIDKLAAYQKSELEPCDYALVRSSLEKEEQARADLNVAVREAVRLGSELSEYHALGALNHLKELVQAEKDGRLVALPDENYTFTIRGDLALSIIIANCRAARNEAQAALAEKGKENA